MTKIAMKKEIKAMERLLEDKSRPPKTRKSIQNRRNYLRRKLAGKR
jgi:hypothetical protein